MTLAFFALAVLNAVIIFVVLHFFARRWWNKKAALQEQITRLEERNESLDRQNQLMERQYNLFATKPVITYLNEEQFSALTRVLASTIIAITKQTN